MNGADATGSSARALLVGDRVALAPFVGALAPLCSRVDVTTSLDDIGRRGAALYVVDGDALSAAPGALGSALPKTGVADRLILLSSSPGPAVAPLVASHAVRHLAPRDGEGAADLVRIAAEKILGGEPFGLQRHFDAAAPTTLVRLRRSDDKREALRAADATARAANASERHCAQFLTVVEELVTNALFDAPVDAHGRHFFAHLGRHEQVVLDEGREVIARFCSTPDRFGVSVTDPFGSLRPERALDYIAKGLRGAVSDERVLGGNRVDSKEGGAGLGLYTVFHAASHFSLHVEPGVRTEAVAVLRFGRGFRAERSGGRSFGVFVKEPPAGEPPVRRGTRRPS